MDDLPRHLLDQILFMIDLKALAMIRCTNRSLQSHTCDPVFESEYFSRIRPGLLVISPYVLSYLRYYSPHDDPRSLKAEHVLLTCHVLGLCSGIFLLLTSDRLCVINPLTKKSRFLSYSKHMTCSRRKRLRLEKRSQMGIAVNRIGRTTQSFKVVHVIEMKKKDETRYWFEINAGNSWRFSETTLTCVSSNLDNCSKTPVYLDRSLHWLRKDGSIVAFNPETEQARLITIKFPKGLSSNRLFAAGDNKLTLVSSTVEAIYVYALENIHIDPKWILVKKQMLNEKRVAYWDVD